MANALAQLQDTLVIDDPDAAAPRFRRPTAVPAPTIGRVPTEDLTMQAFVNGAWHRKMPDVAETPCAVQFVLAPTRTRREKLTHREGRLCTDGCFTPRELELASENDRRAQEEEDRRAQRDHIDSLFRSLPQGDD